MASVVEKYVNEFKAAHGKKNVFTAAMCVLLFFVALAVAWQLKITGISLAGDENISDPKADVETSSQWEATLPQLSDDWKENVSSIALSQLDYAESTKNFVMSDDEKTRKGYTRYGAWFGSEYNDWDALFASFCLEYAGVKKESFPHSVGAQTWIVELQKTQQFVDVASATPQKGDLIFFDTNNDKRANTVGVIVDINEAKDFVVVQGDLDDRVQKIVIASTDPSIMGFGTVPQNPEVIAVLEREKAQAEEQARAEALQAEENQKESDSEDTSNSDNQSSGSDDAPQAESDTNTDDSSTASSGIESDSEATSSSSAEESTPTTSVVVRAEWNEGEPPVDSITVHLIAQGDIDNPLGTMTISSANDWEGVFRNLAVHDSDGKVIEYRVVEDLVTGYDTSCEVSAIPAQAVPEAQDSSVNTTPMSLSKRRALSSLVGERPFAASPLSLSSNVAPTANSQASSEDASTSEDASAKDSDQSTPATLLVLSHTRAAEAPVLRANGDPTIPVTITKEWSDGAAAHTNDSVTVRLTDNGQEQAITLNAQNNWSATALVETLDATVTEDAVEGYEAIISKHDTTSDYWVPALAIEDGETYAVVYDTNQAFTESNFNYLIDSTVDVHNTPVVINGNTYSNYLKDVPASAQWKLASTAAQGYAGYFMFQNLNTGNYLDSTSTSSYLVTAPGDAVPLAYSSDGKLFMPGFAYYLYKSGVLTSQANATTYTLYKKVSAPEGINFTVVNRELASRNESGTSINLKKVWEDTSTSHNPVTIRLFGEDGREVPGCPPVTLGEENNWEMQGAWRNLPERTYTVQEDSVEGYDSIITGSQKRRIIWVPVDNFENGGIYAIVDKRYSELVSTPTYANTSASVFAIDYNTAPSVTRGTTDVTLGDNTYLADSYLVDVPVRSQWVAHYASENAFTLRSAYVNAIEGAWLAHRPNTTNSAYYLTCSSDSNSYSFRNGRYLYNNTYGGYTLPVYYDSTWYNYGLSPSSAETFGLYKQITITDRDFTITNKPEGTTAKPEVNMVNKKYIDALRDSDQHPNPDTTLPVGTDLTDLYRLYLDMKPEFVEQPIDVLIVLDDSGSMGDNTDYEGTQITRTQALKNMLGGSNGLINMFLEMNPENQISVVKFAGSAPASAGGVYSSDYRQDASVITGWTKSWTTTQDNQLEAGLASRGGTNYSAGLLQASELFAANNNNHRKIMFFLSDGVPTFYVGGTDTWGVGGTRYGNGSSESGNVTYCLEPSKDSFDVFKAQNPDVTTYTIGFSNDIAGGVDDVSTSPAVLRYYAEEGKGNFVQASTADILKAEMEQLIRGGGRFVRVGISDKLSSAVDLYEQPDYKLVKETLNKDGSIASTMVMWEGGQPTPDGEGKVEYVRFNKETKTVETAFAPDYALDVNNRYTLSFNVKVTQEAYNTYATNRSNGDEGGYGNNLGSPDTDYRPYEGLLKGVTSSGLPGFNSNEGASLTFKHNSYSYDFDYTNPVVQVGDCSLELLKVDKKDPSKVLKGAKFSLYRRAFPQETGGVSLEGETGTFICVNDSIVTGADGKALVEHLSPGEYYLVETEAPQGYRVEKKPERIVLSRESLEVAPNDTYIFVSSNKRGLSVLQVNNTQSFALPKTGSDGVVPLTVMGTLVMIGSCAIGCVFKRRHRERRFVGTSK